MNILLACLLIATAAQGVAAEAIGEPARLRLAFEIGPETGAIMVALYDSEAGYAARTPVRQARVDVAAGERSAAFELPAGTYAAMAFHDIDGDGRMTLNPFGRPAEPYAFSNNARGAMGPARWDRARFTVAGDTVQTIDLR